LSAEKGCSNDCHAIEKAKSKRIEEIEIEVGVYLLTELFGLD